MRLQTSQGRRSLQGLKPTERLFIEKTLLEMYPRLQGYDLPPWKWLGGSLIPNFLVTSLHADTRRVVVIGCGDGVLANVLSLLFPDVEVIGIDADAQKIAYARSTVSFRNNLKFICGNASVMTEIPCDRIIYNRCLEQLQNPFAFKKLVLKTSQWLVTEGDFIIKESPVALLFKPTLLKRLFPSLQKTRSLERCIRDMLGEIGFHNPRVFQGRGVLRFPSEIFYQASRHFILTAMESRSASDAVSEWQDEQSEESTHSVLGFLFADSEEAFLKTVEMVTPSGRGS